jgi:hypothetical protein
MLLLSWTPPEQWRWLRLRFDLPDDQILSHKVIEEDTPQGLTREEFDQRLRDIEAGRIPPDPPIDWGYGEYLIPLEVLNAHARIEGPFTCDAETEDPIFETTAELGMDFTAECEEMEGGDER